MQKYLKYILILFLITYPIFDLEIFYNSYTTLARIIIIGLLSIATLIYNKESRKDLKYLIIYGALVFIYFIIHHLNALTFTSYVPGNFDYNIVSEALQIIKIAIPVLFLFIVKNIKIEKKDFLNIVKSWIIIICGSIIVSNIFLVSNSSYTLETISGNIFTWFNTSLGYKELSSVGFFKYANQISALLVSIIPVLYYLYIKNKLNISYLILTLITCLMLGTRVSTYGGIMVLFVIFIASIFFKFMKKDNLTKRNIITIILITAIYSVILPFSPSNNRVETLDLSSSNEINLVSSQNYTISKEAYITANYKDKGINEQFILYSYPYQYDADFWYDILQLEKSKRKDFRYLEIAMVKRVVSVNDNNLDIFFGITNTRIQNIFNIERDIVLQYYAYGIIGVILFLGLYFLLFIKKGYEVLKKLNLYAAVNYSVIILFLGISYFSGNTLNQLAVPILIVFILGSNYEEN